ncbi:MAG TPA: ECF-type sigma factor [Solirubrobacterales bacterium]
MRRSKVSPGLCRSAFTIGELDRVLRLALPHFLPGVLDPDEDAKSREEDLDHAAVLSAALRLSEMLDGPQRLVLGMKIAGASDAEIAPVLGVSRRTVTNRKAAAYKALEAVVGPLNEVERLAVLDHLGDVIQNELIQN